MRADRLLTLVYIAAVLTLLIASLYVPRDEIFHPGITVTDAGAATLEVLGQIVELVATLATAMMAAAAALTVKGREWSMHWSRLDSVAIMFVFVFAGISFFGIYLCHVRILSMLQVGAVNATETAVIWSIRLQYWGIIAGVACLGLVFTRMLARRLDAGQPK